MVTAAASGIAQKGLWPLLIDPPVLTLEVLETDVISAQHVLIAFRNRVFQIVTHPGRLVMSIRSTFDSMSIAFNCS
jgi:hypothetical protein